MISIVNNVGRLVEVRFVGPITEAEIAGLESERVRAGREQQQRVVCIDASHMGLLDPERSERIVNALRRPSPGILRRAFLVPEDGAIVALQVARFIREGHMADIKSFTKRQELVAWLEDVLKPAEAARLRVFLEEVAAG